MAVVDRNLFVILAASVLFTNSIREMYRDGKSWSTRFMTIFQIILAFALMMFLRSG